MPQPKMNLARVARAASKYLEQQVKLNAAGDELRAELWTFREHNASIKVRMKHLAQEASIPASHLSGIMARVKAVTPDFARKLVAAHEQAQRPILNL